MNIIHALTLRHLKLNKKRTLVTIIGIIISVAMITAVTTFATSLLSMMQKMAIENTGNWHVSYKDVPIQNVNVVKKDKNVASVALSQDIGYALLNGSKNEDKPYLFVKTFDQQGFETYNVRLIKGRLPEKTNEIVISEHIAENGGVEFNVGDVLQFDVGERTMDGELSLGQDSGLVKPSGDNNGERFIAKTNKEYIVTGIIERPAFEPYWAPGYTVIAYLDGKALAPTDTVNLSIAVKKVSKSLFQQSKELAKKAGISESNIVFNKELLRYYGVFSNDNLRKTLYTLATVVIILIIIGSVSLIYNAFAISISERSRHLGMLASVGATKRQKRSSVYFEGFVVGLIGIPLGIIFGTLGLGVTFILVQPLIEGIIPGELSLVTSFPGILVTVLLSIITIFISVYVPARRASKISPMEAIRQTRDIKLTSKAIKTSKWTRRIFGFDAELGLKNLKRNNRRYKATIFSLVLSIVLYLSVSSLSHLTQTSSAIITENIPYDVKVSVTSSATVEEKKDFYHALSTMEYVDAYTIEQTMYTRLVADPKIIPEEIKAILDYEGSNRKTYDISLQINSIDEAALQRYAKELGIDVDTLKDPANPKGILINSVDVKVDNKYKRMKHFNIEVGEGLEFTHETNYSPDQPTNPNKYTSVLTIAALAEKTPIGETAIRNPARAMMIVSEEVFAAMRDKLPKEYVDDEVDMVEMLIISSNPSKLIESINEYQKQTSISNLYIFDVAKQDRDMKQLNTFIYVFFYGFVALITLISVANIFNTISTSISLRKREFAMLKSVGMTPRGFNKMINYESLFYGIKACVYGLPISFVVMYLIYIALSNSFAFAFTVPWGSVFTAVVVVFAIVSSTMLYASSKIKRENIIDALKEENI